MTKKKEEVIEKEEVVKEKPTAEETDTLKEFNGEEEKVDGLVVGAGEDDTAVEKSKPESTHDLKPTVAMDDSEESKEKIADDEKVKEAVVNGDVVGLNPAQMSVLQKPLVADPQSGRPVYETAEQAMLAQAAAGKLGTPPSTEE